MNGLPPLQGANEDALSMHGDQVRTLRYNCITMKKQKRHENKCRLLQGRHDMTMMI